MEGGGQGGRLLLEVEFLECLGAPSDSTAMATLELSGRDGKGTAADGGGEGIEEPSPSNDTGAMQQRGCIQANVQKHNGVCKEPTRVILIVAESLPAEIHESRSTPMKHGENLRTERLFRKLLKLKLKPKLKPKLKLKLWRGRNHRVDAPRLQKRLSLQRSKDQDLLKRSNPRRISTQRDGAFELTMQ